MNITARVWAFVVYCIFFEAIVWGLFSWAVFVRGHSAWWMLLAFILSTSQLGPKRFGIPQGQPQTKKEESDGYHG